MACALPTVCAWCPGFTPMRGALVVSHGMCKDCEAKLLAEEPLGVVDVKPTGI